MYGLTKMFLYESLIDKLCRYLYRRRVKQITNFISTNIPYNYIFPLPLYKVIEIIT